MRAISTSCLLLILVGSRAAASICIAMGLDCKAVWTISRHKVRAVFPLREAMLFFSCSGGPRTSSGSWTYAMAHTVSCGETFSALSDETDRFWTFPHLSAILFRCGEPGGYPGCERRYTTSS